MYCADCGKKIKENANYCPFCGSAQPVKKIERENVIPVSVSHKNRVKPLPKKNSRIISAVAALLISLSLVCTFFGWLTPRSSEFKNGLSEDLVTESSYTRGMAKSLKNGSLNALEISGFFADCKTSIIEQAGSFDLEADGSGLLNSISGLSLYPVVLLYISLAAALLACFCLIKGIRWGSIPYAVCTLMLVGSVWFFNVRMGSAADAYFGNAAGRPEICYMKLCLPAYLSLAASIAAALIQFFGTGDETAEKPVLEVTDQQNGFSPISYSDIEYRKQNEYKLKIQNMVQIHEEKTEVTQTTVKSSNNDVPDGKNGPAGAPDSKLHLGKGAGTADAQKNDDFK